MLDNTLDRLIKIPPLNSEKFCIFWKNFQSFMTLSLGFYYIFYEAASPRRPGGRSQYDFKIFSYWDISSETCGKAASKFLYSCGCNSLKKLRIKNLVKISFKRFSHFYQTFLPKLCIKYCCNIIFVTIFILHQILKPRFDSEAL